jgi:polyhydroxyalkanoate synthase
MNEEMNEPVALKKGEPKKKKKKKASREETRKTERKAAKLALRGDGRRADIAEPAIAVAAKEASSQQASPAASDGNQVHGLEKAVSPPPLVAEPTTDKKAEPAEPESKAGPDLERLATNVAAFIGQSSKVMAAYFQPFQSPQSQAKASDEAAAVMRTLGRVAEHWLSDPKKTLEAQNAFSGPFLGLWAHTLRRFSGFSEPPVVAPDPADKRFATPQWQESPLFDFFRQIHAITTTWADDLAVRAESVDPHTRDKARFYLRQISSALAPSNFVATNPELLRETINSNAENLLRGIGNLANDMEAGKGSLRIRQTDVSKFELGVNVAATPGKVILRNDLIELIQYAPTTETVNKRPLLIVPPWINKFYILDLNPDKSFVRWAVAQGQTVFMISWVNAEATHRDKDWNAYMREGIFAALEAIEQTTGERDVNTIGYCVGGTLLSATLAYMAETQDERIKSATFFAAQTDFSEAGDLKVYIDEEQLASIESSMRDTGYLDGSKMASAFNMLRPNDLIWPYVVNNYLKGQQPAAFDLLAWNSDSTRIPAANHSFYLRCCYLENRLAKGEMELGGKKLSLGKIKIPIYSIATQEDHIAPAKSVFNGVKLFGGDVRFVLGGSGHIAGIINPPTKPKYQYWLGPKPGSTLEDWRAATTEHPGSWWLDWIEWLRAQGSEQVAARVPGDGKLTPLCDAPGDYVRVKI